MKIAPENFISLTPKSKSVKRNKIADSQKTLK